MNKVEKKLDVLCLGAAVVDIPLRPVSREVFDIESYPVDNIAMAVGGDAQPSWMQDRSDGSDR